MSESTYAPTELVDCIQTEVTLITTFVDILQREAGVLAAGADSDALAEVTQEKNTFAQRHAALADRRNELLIALGYGSDKDGLSIAAGTFSELTAPIHELLDKTAQASLLNTGNGQIIDRFLNHHTDALNALRHLTGRSQLYDASGRTRPTRAPRAGHSKSA